MSRCISYWTWWIFQPAMLVFRSFYQFTSSFLTAFSRHLPRVTLADPEEIERDEIWREVTIGKWVGVKKLGGDLITTGWGEQSKHIHIFSTGTVYSIHRWNELKPENQKKTVFVHMHIILHTFWIQNMSQSSTFPKATQKRKKTTRPVPKAFARLLQSAGTDVVAPHVVTIHGYVGFWCFHLLDTSQ